MSVIIIAFKDAPAVSEDAIEKVCCFSPFIWLGIYLSLSGEREKRGN